MLLIYRAFIFLLMPLLPLYLNLRARRGKEHPARLMERRGIATIPRPEGDIFWFHAASVGESISAMVLAGAMAKERPDAYMLITTGTTTSADAVARRASEFGLGGRLIHQFVPLDCRPWVRRFLHNWQPRAAIIVEGDLWPNMLLETAAAGVPLSLASAQISDKSLQFWQGIGSGMAARIFPHFDAVLTVDEDHAARFQQLPVGEGCVQVSGSMKMAAPALPDMPELSRAISDTANGREVIALLSSHPGEETLFIEAAERLDRDRYLAIIAPRHPQRARAIVKEIEATGNDCPMRSAGEWPNLRQPYWLADRMGEMGGLIRAADTIVLGGGFTPLGGHNPMEPAALGKGVISGRNVFKNRVAFDLLASTGGVIFAETAAEIADCIEMLSSSPSKREQHDHGAQNAWRKISTQADTAAARLLALVATRQP